MPDPQFSEKLWSEICEEVDKDMQTEDKAMYQFSNGRRLDADGPYEPTA